MIGSEIGRSQLPDVLIRLIRDLIYTIQIRKSYSVKFRKTRTDGKLDQFGAGMHIQFIHDAFTMAGYRFGAESKAFADLLVV
jgi:hypothetical protein